MMQSVTTQLN